MSEKGKSVKEFECELCDYSCEKIYNLKKHINSKHTKHKCKVCSKEFKTSTELVVLVAKEHQEQEEARTSTPKYDMEGKQSSFKFSESMTISSW